MSTKIITHCSDNGRLHSSLVERIVESGLPSEAIVIYRGRNVVATVPSGEITVNIKAFALPNIVNRFVYGRFRDGKARRSFFNSCRLLEMGFKVPDPIAFIEERGLFTFGRSFYLSRHMEELTEMRYPERHTFMKPLLEALGREMARLHKAGVWMKDFSPGNVLFTCDDDGSSFSFYFVDLNSIEFDTFSPTKLDHMWERILFDREQLAIATRSYAMELGLDPDKVLQSALRRWQDYVKRHS